MTDDELGRHLRAEVPEPGDGYWASIDERLAGVDAEPTSPESDAGSHTTDGVIRLTAMNQLTESSRSARMPRLMAMAAAVVLIAGVAALVVAAGSDRADTETTADDVGTTADDGETSNEGAMSDDTAVSGEDAPDASAGIESAELGDAELDPLSPGEYLVIGSFPVEAKLNPLTEETGLDAVFGPGDSSMSSTGRRVIYDDAEWLEITFGGFTKNLWFPAASLLRIGEPLPTLPPFEVVTVAADPLALNDVPGFGRVSDRFVEPNTAVLATGERALVDHREWLEISDDDDVFGWVRATDVDVAASADSIIEAEPLPMVEPTSLEVGRGGDLEILDRPSFDGERIGSASIGGIVEGTGRRALANGVEWSEVVLGQGQTGWSMAASLQAVGTIGETSRLCYTDTVNVLVLDFDGTGETFTGGFAFLDSIEAVAGVGVGGQYIVATRPLGSGEDPEGPLINDEVWQAVAEGMSVGERAFLEFTECTDVQSTADQLDRLIGEHPPFPFPD